MNGETECSAATSTALSELSAAVNAEHALAFGKAREALEHARRAGELLRQAKAQLEHGAWLPWLKDNCHFAERTAQAYMRLARDWSKLEVKSATVADLTVRDAVRQLASNASYLGKLDGDGIDQAQRILETGYAGGRLNSAVIEAQRKAKQEARALECREAAERFASTATVFVHDGQPVRVRHLRGNTWAVEVGGNQTGRKFSPVEWETAAKEVSASLPQLESLRQAKSHCEEEVKRLERELKAAEEQEHEARHALRRAALRHLEELHGVPRWGSYHSTETSPEITQALLSLSDEELGEFADAFVDAGRWEELMDFLELGEVLAELAELPQVPADGPAGIGAEATGPADVNHEESE